MALGERPKAAWMFWFLNACANHTAKFRKSSNRGSFGVYSFFTKMPLTYGNMIDRMEGMVATDKAEEIVASAAADIGQMDIPGILQSRIARQNAHLVELASNLIASGMDEVSIKSVIGGAMASYEQELVQTIIALKKEAGRV